MYLACESVEMFIDFEPKDDNSLDAGEKITRRVALVIGEPRHECPMAPQALLKNFRH